MKIFTVVGARPQFVKAAVVSRAFAETGIEECLVHTGQHFDESMSDVFFRELNIPSPSYNLNINSLNHGAMTGRMLEKLEELLLKELPDWVVVYGDTNSTLAAALAASKLHIPVAHIEAGLRSFNRQMPEEVNRVVTDHISNLLFCSSSVGQHHLANEGISKGVHIVGDVMADASLLARGIVNKNASYTDQAVPPDLRSKPFSLLTLHRAENTDDPERLLEIVNGLNALDRHILFPIHPRTKAAIFKHGYELKQHIYCVAPLGYLQLTAALLSSEGVITDSGGLQKEAYWARKPCLTIRDETEWTETIEEGWNQLVAPSEIARATLTVPQHSQTDSYGSGQASRTIADILREI